MAGIQNRSRKAAITVALILLAGHAIAGEVRIVGVTDGDTVRVLDSEKHEIKIRLSGIDAPEKKQAFSEKSKQALSEKVFGKVVTLEDKGKDRYGRTLGVLIVDGRNVNQEMVAEGWAHWYEKYAPKDTKLRDAEAAARKGKLGLWADAMPVPPWEFRKAKQAKK
jgi:micrococcal nuclease